MNVGAHPLVVAVALGLLGPSVLTAVEREDDRCARGCPGADEGEPVDAGASAPAAVIPEVDPLSVDRVEAIWTGMRR